MNNEEIIQNLNEISDMAMRHKEFKAKHIEALSYAKSIVRSSPNWRE